MEGQIWEEPEHLIDNGEFYESQSNKIGYHIFKMNGDQVVFGQKSNGSSGYMYLKNGLLEFIGKCLVNGYSIRKTSRETRCDQSTASKLRNKLNAILNSLGKNELLCDCGRPLTHKGVCLARRPEQKNMHEQTWLKLNEKERNRIIEKRSYTLSKGNNRNLQIKTCIYCKTIKLIQYDFGWYERNGRYFAKSICNKCAYLKKINGKNNLALLQRKRP